MSKNIWQTGTCNPQPIDMHKGKIWRQDKCHRNITILSCYSSIPFIVGLKWRDGGLNILCQSCGFACQYSHTHAHARTHPPTHPPTHTHTHTHTHITSQYKMELFLTIADTCSLQLLIFVTKGSILDAAGVLGLTMPKTKIVELNTYG